MGSVQGARFSQAKAYLALQAHAAQVREQHLKQMFQADPQRATKMAIRTQHAFLDFSRQRMTVETLRLLWQLADERNLSGHIEAMFSGEKINNTEDRAVLHTALRQQSDEPVLVDGHNVIPDIKAVLSKIKIFSERVLSGDWRGASGKPIKNIVAIGIGGSYLGPEYLAEACKVYAQKGMTLRFVANVDGTDFAQKTADLNPEETLFIIVSKTFTTAETMKNAETAKGWMLGTFPIRIERFGPHPNMGVIRQDIIKKHFVAVSTAADLVEKFGIDTNNMFGFWNWVGGRYSATSAVGAVPLSLFLGYEGFEDILRGANWMDVHFRTAPFTQNIPVLQGLTDVWNINFMDFNTRALLAYCQAMLKYAPHVQQNDMESNGKLVDQDGNPVDYKTGEVIFGEPGTNGQHSFYQLLHQGTSIIPADFIGFIKPQYPVGRASATDVDHHQELMMNFFAQPDALAFGQDSDNPAKYFPGNRPSSSLLLQKLTPFTAGLMLALAEHRTAVKGFIWGINSFDQFGVELGKKLAVALRARMVGYNGTGQLDISNLDPSTATLMTAFALGQLPVSH